MRHYYQLGLLDKAAWRPSGYKQYVVKHLVRLPQITRLTELGVLLAQIKSIGLSVDDLARAIRTGTALLATTVVRLQRIRGESAATLENRTNYCCFSAGRRCPTWGATDDLKQMLVDSPRTGVIVELDGFTHGADRETRRPFGGSTFLCSGPKFSSTNRWVARLIGLRAARRSDRRRGADG